MMPKKLEDVLKPPPESSANLRWQVAVPLSTNPFILAELLQFAFVGGFIALITLSVGVWFMEGMISSEDIVSSMSIALVVILGVLGAFFLISVLFFGNRYFATYRLDAGGIYQEGTRGNDGGPAWSLKIHPFPIVGSVMAERTRSRHLPWEKVDRFQDIPSMRTVLLRRGFWHMARLYTPDAQTHEQVVSFLARRLEKVRSF